MNSQGNLIAGVIIHWLIRWVGHHQPTRMSDYSTVIIQPSSINQLAWLIIRVIDYSAMIRQCLINQLAWLIIRQWLSHIDYSWFINQLIKSIIHSSSQSSSINQLAWLIIRVIDYSAMIRQWLINQLAWLIIWQWLSHIDYSWLINQLIKLIIHSSSQSSSINQPAWLIIRVSSINQPAWLIIRVIDYSTTVSYTHLTLPTKA